WRKARVRVQVGYIIGLPHDTEESVGTDVERLIREVQPDQASFLMMIPLPGSEDHKRLVASGVAIDPDYNKYDSCHETMPHARMSGEEWTAAYREAWRRFYSLENMKAILGRVDPSIYWDVLRNFWWYKYAVVAEGAHPMLTGFFRLKDRTTRRPGFAREGRVAHLRRRIPEVQRLL
ncbi:MAG: radical SAM protein, partial [Bryobacteraceae bacterium]